MAELTTLRVAIFFNQNLLRNKLHSAPCFLAGSDGKDLGSQDRAGAKVSRASPRKITDITFIFRLQLQIQKCIILWIVPCDPPPPYLRILRVPGAYHVQETLVDLKESHSDPNVIIFR